MKKYSLLPMLFGLFLVINSSNSNAKSFITPSKKIYRPGEKIRINFSGFPGFEKDWIGIYSQSQPDIKFITWKYTAGNKKGAMEFDAPQEPGRYELRGFVNNGYQRVATSQLIDVGPVVAETNNTPVTAGTITTGMTLNGNAKKLNSRTSNFILLTNDYWQSSSAFMTKAVRFKNNTSFSASFSFEIDNPRGLGYGADGICFVMQAESVNAGGIGGGIGYAGLKQSAAVEFDTYNNGEINDNHIGIDLNGDMNSAAVIAAPEKLDDNKPWYAWVDYNGSTKIMEVRVSRNATRPTAAILSYKTDLASLFNNKPIFMGFTSGTGAGAGDHKIFSWKFDVR